MAPVYQRGRIGAGDVTNRYRMQGYGGLGHGATGYGGYHGRGRFDSPQIYGSWYQRPYPHHLDYHRLRYNSPQVAPECPCEQLTDAPTTY